MDQDLLDCAGLRLREEHIHETIVAGSRVRRSVGVTSVFPEGKDRNYE
jgi:hypothetical protein